MDSITHVLAPIVVTAPLRRPDPSPGVAEERWRETLALLLGALLPDADGVSGFVSLLYYEKYHRVISHSILSLCILSVVCAWLAMKWPRWLWWPSWRHLRGEGQLKPPPFRRLWALASIALFTHFAGDWITHWGIWPFWPWIDKAHGDFSIKRVNSLDPVMLTMTVAAWAVQHWFVHNKKIRASWIVAAIWFLACALYVWLRPVFGAPAYV